MKLRNGGYLWGQILKFTMGSLVGAVAFVQSAEAHISTTWNSSSGNWTDSARWSCYPEYPKNGQPTAGSTYSVHVNGGNVTRDTAVSISTLDLSGGVINGASALTVIGAMSWSGGAVETGDLFCNGGLAITGSTRFYGSSAELTLAGAQTASITGAGSLGLEYQTTVINNGTFYARNDNAISEIGSLQSNFTNNGTFTRDTSSGTFTMGATQFNNSGTLNVNTGTLDVVHGISNTGAIQIAAGATLKMNSASIFDPGTSFSGSGLWWVADNEQHMHPSVTLPNAVKLDSAGKISVYNGHTLTLNGPLTWSGGELACGFNGQHSYVSINNGAVISSNSDFRGLTITNAIASDVILNNSTLLFKGDSIFQNAGIFHLQSNAVLDKNLSSLGNVFNNTGSFIGSGSAFSVNLVEIPFNNSGTVSAPVGTLRFLGGGAASGGFDASSGASIEWEADYAFHAGTTFAGVGHFGFVAGIHNMDASLVTGAEINIYSNLSISPGITFTNNGALFFSGTLSGGGALTSNNQLRLGGGTVNGSNVINSTASVAEHVDAFFGNVLTLANGGKFQNHGTYLAKDGLGVVNGAGSGNQFINTGTFTRNFSNGPYSMAVPFTNTGTVNGNTGTLDIAGGGTSTGGVFAVAAAAKTEFSGNYTFASGNSTSGPGLFVLGTESASQALAIHTISGNMTAASQVMLGNSTASIAPAATFTVTGALNALLGTITGGGALHANGGSSIGNIMVDGASLSLGTGPSHLHASSSPLVLSNGGVVGNSGTFLAQGDHDYVGASAYGISAGAGMGGVFNNSGTFTRDTGLGVYAIGVPFHNLGMVSSQSGVLLFDRGGSSTDGTWDTNGGLLQLRGDFAFNGTTALTGAGTLQLGTGTHTVNGPMNAAGGLAIYGPAVLAVQLAQVVTVGGLLSLLPDPLEPAVITGGGTVQADGGIVMGAATIDGATLDNALLQTATHASGLPITLKSGGVFNNAGIYLAQADAVIDSDTAPLNLFHNSGTFTRDTSAGTYTVNSPFENTGAVNIDMGTLAFTKGVATTGGSFHTAVGAVLSFSADTAFNSPAPFIGGGNVQFTGGVHSFIQSAVSSSELTLAVAEMVIPTGVAMESNGIFHAAGGLVSGAGSLNANSGFDLTGSMSLSDATLNLTSGQTASQTGAGNLTLNGTATLNNFGSYHAGNDHGVIPGTGAGSSFHNSGTLVRDTGLGVFTVAVPFHHGGSLDVQSGTLAISGGGTSIGIYHVEADKNLTISGNTDYSGASEFTGTGNINFQNGVQTITDSMDSSVTLNLSGGTLNIAPAQLFQSNGIMNWSGGPVTGGGILGNTGDMSLTGSLTLDGATLRNTATGVASIEGVGSLALKNSALLDNQGTLFLLNNGAITAGDASAASVENSGIVTRDIGTGSFTIGVPFNHSGTFNLNSGSVWINGGGTATNSIFHALTGAGLHIGDNYTFGANNTITGSGSSYFTNGSLHVTGSLTTDGSFNWSGGTLDGGGVFAVKGGLSIAPGAGGVFINGSILENAVGSEAIISGASATHISNGGTYRNAGLTRLQGNNTFTDDGGGANSIVNSGTLIRDAGTGSYTVTLPIHNTGTIRSSSGALLLNAGGSASAGALDANGGDIYLNGGSYEFSGGALTGSSFVYLTAGTALVTGDTGATSGPATGGFGIAGGTLGGSSMLSVERGYFSTGTMTGTAVLRLTGASSKVNNTHFTMSGGTIQNDGSYSQGVEANWDLDTSDVAGGGTILNNGTWTLTAGSSFSNTYGGGSFDNAGTFHQAVGYSWMRPAFHNRATGVLNSTSNYVLLAGGGSQTAGSILNANGGDIYFYGGTHQLNGGTFTGSSFTYASLGTVSVNANVGATTGNATGGFGVSGATVTGTGLLSADHGYFSTGQISGEVVLRFTGASSKEINTHLTMSGGTIQNDGTFTQGANANYDLDNSDVAGGGKILNNGTWTLTNGSSFSNTYGGGVFNNPGILNQSSGENYIYAAFHNTATGVINAISGAIHLMGGGTQATGSVLNAASGNIYFQGGTHELNDCSIIGNSYVYALAGTVNINGSVNASTGPATGGFSIYSIGGNAYVGGTGTLSVEHGYLDSGYITGSPVLRFTGTSSKGNNTYLGMSGGTLQNDGAFTQGANANYDLDNSDTAGGGKILNSGTWTLTNGSSFSNTYGGGVFNNPGILNQSGGDNYIYAAFHNTATGVINATSGAIHLMAGGTQAAGSVLNASGGNIYFRGGTHELNGCDIIGSNSAYAMNGTVNINQNVNATSGPATGGFALYSYNGTATLGGSAMLSVERGYFSSGLITGDVVLRMTGESSTASNSSVTFYGGTIRNEGTFTQESYASYDLDGSSAAGGGTLVNTGTWNLNNSSYFSNGNGGGSIINSGAFNFLGGSSHFYAGFQNQSTGIINATVGNVYFIGNSTHAAGSVLNADAGSIVFQYGNHQLDGGTLTGTGWAYAYSGTLNVTGDVNAASGPATGGFALYSYNGNATLGGSAMLSVERGYFSSGLITGDVVLRLTGESSTASNSSVTFCGGTIRNEGTFTQGGSYASYDLDGSPATGGGTLVNTGIWNLNTSSNFANGNGGGVFNNSGTLNQSAGVTYIYASFNNQATGVIHATAGSIHLSGGGVQATGSVLNADGGDIYLGGGLFTMNQATISGSDSVYATGGTVNINENVGATTGAATGGFGVAHYSATITGTGMLSAERGYLGDGTISGSPVLRFTGASSKGNYSSLNMSGGTIQNDGVFTQDFQANYDLDNSSAPGGGTLQNNGTWNLTGSSNFSNTYGGGTFNNPGTLNQSGGDSYMYALFQNAPTGVVNATSGIIRWLGGSSLAVGNVLNANGGSIYFQGGTHEWNGGTLTGSTTVYAISGTVNINGNVGAATGAATGGFGISGTYATIAGTGMLSAERGELGYGNISGSPVLRFTGASSKANYSQLNMSGGTIQNDGVFTQDFQANYDLDFSSAPGGGKLQNNGTWNLIGSSSFANSQGGGVFNNLGTLNQSGGDSYMYAAFQNTPTGVVNATAGVIRWLAGSSLAVGNVLNADGGSIYFQGGTHEWNGGTITGSTNVYAVGGTVNINGNVGATTGAATGGFGISGNYVAIAGTGMLSAERGDLGYGNISGSPVLRFTGASSKANYSHLAMSGGTIVNDGVFTQDYQANFDLDNSSSTGGGTLQNNGIWTLTNGSHFGNSYGGGVFNNSGTLNQSGGANYIYASLTNSGTVHASGGTLYLYGGSSHSGALVADSHIVLGAGFHSMTGGSARLSGSGALSGNLTITDGAQIAPGESLGRLSLYGQVSFASGGAHPACVMELGGTSAFDQIDLGDGSALTLGTDLTELRISLLYAPVQGDTFRIIDSSGGGHLTGTFRNLPSNHSVITATYGGRTYDLGVTYDGAGKAVDLTVLTPYQAWAYGKGLSNGEDAFDADPDGDGVMNGIEFVVGGEPNPSNPNSDSQDLLPQIIVDETYLRVIYRRKDESVELAQGVEFSGDFETPWTIAQVGEHGVLISVVDDGFGLKTDRVEVLIPRSNEVNGKLFGRLKVSSP